MIKKKEDWNAMFKNIQNILPTRKMKFLFAQIAPMAAVNSFIIFVSVYYFEYGASATTTGSFIYKLGEFLTSYWYVLVIVFLIDCVLSFPLLIYLNFMYNKLLKEHQDKVNLKFSELDAPVVESRDARRRNLFNVINSAATRTYHAYGIGLTTLSSQEDDMIKGFVNDSIKVTLCMANPNIFKESVCVENIKKRYCGIASNLETCPSLNCEIDLWIENKIATFPQDLLDKYGVIFQQSCLKEYFGRDINYYSQIEQSYNDMKDIIRAVKDSMPPTEASKITERIDFRKVNSFLPFSMTIVDKDMPNAQMIVEYILPYTSKRIMLHIKKENFNNEFNYFSELYDKIYDKSVNVDPDEVVSPR